MRTALVIGNGLTISQQRHLGCDLDSSSPFSWPVPMPGEECQLLIDNLPYLKSYLESENPGGDRTDFDVIGGLVAGLSNEPIPSSLPDDEQGVLLDTCHFLAVGFGWFQNQVDDWAAGLEGWDWNRWMADNNRKIICVLSWNYDLTIERLLGSARRPFYCPGFVSSGFDPQGMNWHLSAVPVCKPHGSTNFVHWNNVGIRAARFDGDPGESLTYPRQIAVVGFDGPMEALAREKLQSVRSVADVVLPGEWNRFGGYIQWVGQATQAFSDVARNTEHLIVVGFSMSECDREEFLRAIDSASNLKRITIANPHPNKELIDCLRGRASELLHWPDGPFGPEVEL